ncbi:HPS3, biogenesis of lysosomal organelles complex 2 subunit 1 L homeolog isoform X1 [Xenopus laevis]|uniref:HPS3, biogenesis of lysosomal organelles complex 2 subunit 1 L homeolog isoform X1 n=2 Tax=Xenopus laevis TaxID=8355 RepID=A0A8J1KL53_XENLA|nr:HPS3, biogenesis of lysosomal organelles complex 2 subunit 1 L homeolog isoform X1 [Xenopus laevis]
MVRLYNCHPFGSQRIVPTKQAPDLFCCGRDSVFVISAGGCKVEVFTVCQNLCQPLCSFSTLGKVLHMAYNDVGDYLVTIEEKNNVSSLRAYVNWRCSSSENPRVSVRMVGLKLKSPHIGASKDQMEIIEMPLSEPPLCIACCPVQGDLLVGCKSKLIIFHLKNIFIQDSLVLDFDGDLILHVTGIVPVQASFCAGYIGIMNDLEVLVMKLVSTSSETPFTTHQDMSELETFQEKVTLSTSASQLPESSDFVICQRPMELIGEECKMCGIGISPESTGLSSDFQNCTRVCHLLYRRFAPDFTEGIHVENTRLHSLQLMPMYKTGSGIASDPESATPQKELLAMFCFFSMPNTGFLYSIGSTVVRISLYQYPEMSQQAVLTPQFLHVITRNNLQCFTVRCSAAAAREEDPYIDTTMKSCPPVSMDVCTLRMQLFIGLKAIAHFKKYLIILTKTNIDDTEEKGRSTPQRQRSKKPVKNKTTEDAEPSWNLYVVSTTPIVQLYKEMVEYSKRYETAKTQGSIHLLNEAHLLLRSALMDPNLDESIVKSELIAAFRESCAHLGDWFSRLGTKHSHLALPYYKMSCLSISDIINRIVGMEMPRGYGKGFLFYLKHALFEEQDEQLSEAMALKVIEIFNAMEKTQLPHVLCSPCLAHVSPRKAMGYLQNLQPSTLVSLIKANMARRMNDLDTCKNEIQHHSEMMLLCAFMDEPRLLMNERGKDVIPTALAFYFKDAAPGLLVASLVALHENNKINLAEAELFFKALCEKMDDEENVPQMLVDFWEARLSTYPPESVLQDILFKLTSYYVWRICRPHHLCVKPLKSPEDLRNSCSHFGLISPWTSKMMSKESALCYDCGEFFKLQSLLSGPSMDVKLFLPFLKLIPEDNNSCLSIHILCATRLMQYEKSIEKLLDRCPEAVISYAKHEVKEGSRDIWWNMLLPELCNRIRSIQSNNEVFISSLKDTLEMIAMELDTKDFLNALPDDGTAAFFLPYLLNQSKKKLTV